MKMTDAKKSLMITGKEAKEFFSSLRQFFIQYYKDFFAGVKTLEKSDLIVKIGMVLAICTGFAFFCYLREGTGDLYMSVFIPAFFANAFVVFFGCVNKSSKYYSIITIILVITGFALQIFMIDPFPTEEGSDPVEAVNERVIFIFAGILFSMLAMPILAFITSENTDTKVLRYLIIGGTVVLYGLLLVLGKEVNGAKAWIDIGFSIQVTEITKVLAGIYFVLCVTDNNLSEKEKSIRKLLALLIHAGFLALVNEFGTLIMIGFIYLFLNVMFTKNKKLIIKELVCLVIIFALLLGVCYVFYKTAPETTEEKATVAAEELIEEETTETTASQDADEAEKKQLPTPQKLVDEALGRVRSIYPKFTDRISGFLGIGEPDKINTYQVDSVKMALHYAEWFGTEKGWFGFVPEIDCDFVFVYLVARLGIIGSIVVLIAFVLLFTETLICAVRSENIREAALAICFICLIVVQSIICMLSNLALFPVVGMPLAFLSDGGSALVVNMVMSFFIMYFMREKRVLPVESEATENV